MKPKILKEFCIQELKNYQLSVFLNDCVKHGLDKPGFLSAACPNKQNRATLSKVVQFVREDAASHKLFECSKLDTSDATVRNQIYKYIEDIEKRVMTKLAALEKKVSTREGSETWRSLQISCAPLHWKKVWI
jgi:hypothetical protein